MIIRWKHCQSEQELCIHALKNMLLSAGLCRAHAVMCAIWQPRSSSAFGMWRDVGHPTSPHPMHPEEFDASGAVVAERGGLRRAQTVPTGDGGPNARVLTCTRALSHSHTRVRTHLYTSALALATIASVLADAGARMFVRASAIRPFAHLAPLAMRCGVCACVLALQSVCKLV
eukprot:1245460-Pleurochrysis_carterae.AAC.4